MYPLIQKMHSPIAYPKVVYQYQLKYPEGWITQENYVYEMPAYAAMVCGHPTSWYQFKKRYHSFKTRIKCQRLS